MIQLQNYTNKRMDNLIEGLKELHKALIRHGDPKPRNMMVVKNDPERVIWIDFDRAETYDQDQMTQKQKALIKEEEEIVISFKDCLVSFVLLELLYVRLILTSHHGRRLITQRESLKKLISFTVLNWNKRFKNEQKICHPLSTQ